MTGSVPLLLGRQCGLLDRALTWGSADLVLGLALTLTCCVTLEKLLHLSLCFCFLYPYEEHIRLGQELSFTVYLYNTYPNRTPVLLTALIHRLGSWGQIDMALMHYTNTNNKSDPLPPQKEDHALLFI